MNVVFIVPTGIGAEIGGHSGDATPAAKLIASICDKLIIHPNVVNASDINEMTENMLYVEGYVLDKFLEGAHNLKETKGNSILVAVNKITPEIINAVSAARATIGAHIRIICLNKPIKMVATVSAGIAVGKLENVDEAINQMMGLNVDAVVVHTPIQTDDDEVLEYLNANGGVNVWGKVEADLSKKMSNALNLPVIHAPVESIEVFKKFNQSVDPRKAAEMVSVCYLHCCLKGAHVAPKICYGNGIKNTDIDFMITPANVFGRPHKACVKHGIPVIAVKENKTVLNDAMPDDFIIVENYLEAAGVIAAKKAGVTLESVRRPLKETEIIK